jgi:hypothetical protein
VIDEQYGVFVSPAGDDESGEGTRARPYATIGRVIEAAVAGGLRVYACADGGVYEESVAIGTEASGLEMYGGFSCDDWSYSREAKSLVSTTEQLALRVEGVVGLRIEDFGFQAADATVPGGSSMGAFVMGSKLVVLRRVRFEAGKGMAGAAGEAGQAAVRRPDRGNASSDSAGGAAKECSCEGQQTPTIGGAGGDVPNQSGHPGLPDWGRGKGGAVGTCDLVAQRGADAPPQPPSLGATLLGVLSAAGWAPASGENGTIGYPGQGGGGGASDATEGGGGGGCGGCGGGAGSGGQGGGASVALAILTSSVTLEDSELLAALAGDSGNGAAGGEGQKEADDGGAGRDSCDGGAGGYGGRGGAGGGGAGGISVGVLWRGESGPSILGNEYTLGSPGAKGIGGEPGVNDGIEGVAEEVLEIL